MEVSEIFNVLGEINYNLKFLTNLVTFDSQNIHMKLISSISKIRRITS